MIPRITAATTTLLLALALASCAGAPEAESAPTPKPAKPTPEASVDTPAPEEPAADPTCDTIVSPGTVQVLTDEGWTFEEKEFMIGDVPMPNGLLCFWADYSVPSDHGQLYGWSAIEPEQAAQAQTSLLADGWTREDGAEGIYITEDPQFAMGTDEEGYGMTYLFGDGWVKFADTKQSLILVGWAG